MTVEGRSDGPSVVAIGGGHGLAASLRALRAYAGSITAIVSVADDGGSSGRLRAAMPTLPAPGDVRRCLSALADPSLAVSEALEYRFTDDDGAQVGHALGNLMLTALTWTTGSFAGGVEELGRMVGAVGRVLPATAVPVTLQGRVLVAAGPAGSGDDAGGGAPGGDARGAGVGEGGADGGADEVLVEGQVAIQGSRGVRGVSLLPPDAPSPPGVADAIAAADQIVLGPGSLFTSVLAAAVAPDVRDALWKTDAQRVYVANLRPQVPETEGFTLDDHVGALLDHDVPVDVVVSPAAPGGSASGRPGEDLPDARTVLGISVVSRPVADDRGVVHDPARLAAALAEVLERR